ncbi:putative SOS response-associated peptidase YedK [compost metagenome]
MIDIHDRRPLAVSAEDARHRLDPKLTSDEAVHIARTAMLYADLFEWHTLSTELNRGADGPQVAAPLASTE